MFKKILVTGSLLTFFLSLAVTAQEHIIKIDRNGPEKKVIKIEKDLLPPHFNLTDEQKKAFKKIDLGFKKETLPLRNELEVKQLELEAEKTEDQPDLKKINPLVDDVYRLQASIEKKRIAADLQKRSLLDAEQRKAWDDEGPFEGRNLRMRLSGEPDRLMWFQNDQSEGWEKKLGEDIEKEIEREIEIR